MPSGLKDDHDQVTKHTEIEKGKLATKEQNWYEFAGNKLAARGMSFVYCPSHTRR